MGVRQREVVPAHATVVQVRGEHTLVVVVGVVVSVRQHEARQVVEVRVDRGIAVHA